MKLREKAQDVLKSPGHVTAIPSAEPLVECMKIWMSGMPGTEEAALDSISE